MPNSSRPRQRCLNCKSRHLKCDRGIPHCLKCIKANIDCLGYRENEGLEFREMNEISERKVKSRTTRRGDTKVGLTKSQYLLLDGSNGGAYTAATQLHRLGRPDHISTPLTTDWREIAIPKFLADYVFQSDVAQWGNFHFVSDVFSKSMAQEALQAVALTSLANQIKVPSLITEARKHYCEAIIRIANALGDIEEAKKDSTLASVNLLHMFELLTTKPLPKLFWRSPHDRGRESLLVLRGKTQFRTSVAKNLFFSSFRHYIFKCLTGHIYPREEPLMWLKLSDMTDPASQLMHCLSDTARFCSSAQLLFDSSSMDKQWPLSLVQLVKEGISIEKAYRSWRDSISDIWNYKSCVLPVTVVHSYLPHVYHDVYVAFTWNTFRSARIRLHEVLLHCIKLIRSHPTTERPYLDLQIAQKESISTVAEMVIEICSSMPFCLGEVDSNMQLSFKRPMPLYGYLALWPLYIAIVSASARQGSETEAWLRGKLEYIRASMGIELARRLAIRGKVCPWDIR